MRIKVIAIGAFAILSATTFAQPPSSNSYHKLPEVGKPIPDFTLSKLTHYKSIKASSRDFKGKWLILDFWETGCISCIKSFPKINLFQQQFKGQVQFVLVGATDNEWNTISATEALFEKLRVKQNLNLIAAYDSALWVNWKIWSYPYMIIVDPLGIVRVISHGKDITAEKIQQLLDGQHPAFESVNLTTFNVDQQDSVNGKAAMDSNLLFRSILRKASANEEFSFPNIEDRITDERLKRTTYVASRIPLIYLYFIAYTGKPPFWAMGDSLCEKMYPLPVLEISDTSLFSYDKSVSTAKGYYDYSLTVSSNKATSVIFMEIMQRDLKSYFGYDADIEYREVPVWKLVATPNANEKLKTKGGMPYYSGEGLSGGAAGFTWRNGKANLLINVVKRYLDTGGIPVFDETGLTGNIDITIDALMSDMHLVTSELKRNGLDLVKGEKGMNVIVIRSHH